MVKAQQKTRRPGRPGHLGDAAREIGVNHSHLWRVVHGLRDSPPTMARYLEWRRRNLPGRTAGRASGQ